MKSGQWVAFFLLPILGMPFALEAAALELWDISGTISSSGKVTFDPLFRMPADNAEMAMLYAVDAAAGGMTCKGSYTLEVQDDSGKPLFVCPFEPATPIEERGPDMQVSGVDTDASALTKYFTLHFHGMASSRTLAVKDPKGRELGRLTLQGMPPAVSILSPAAGFTGKGKQKIEWKVKSGRVFYSRLFFSKDAGSHWDIIESGTKNETSSLRDFDEFPASDHALIRVLVSDGMNTGMATSEPFTIPRKNRIQVVIDNPQDHWTIKGSGYTQKGISHANDEIVFLLGNAYSVDDGTLDGEALVWFSDVQGRLGTGHQLAAHLKQGHHVITLQATDSKGNAVSESREITITPWTGK